MIRTFTADYIIEGIPSEKNCAIPMVGRFPSDKWTLQVSSIRVTYRWAGENWKPVHIGVTGNRDNGLHAYCTALDFTVAGTPERYPLTKRVDWVADFVRENCPKWSPV